MFIAKAAATYTPPVVVTPAKNTSHPKNTVAAKSEFPAGSIVSVNGRDMDGRLKVRKNAPMLYGVVEVRGEDENVKYIRETNEMISFLVSGKYKWYNKNGHNVLTSSYHTGLLTMYSRPHNFSKDQDPFSDEDPLCWFTKMVGGWKVKCHEEPCCSYGSPKCLYNSNKAGFKNLIKCVGNNGDCVTNSQCCYKCYNISISRMYGTLGYPNRRRIG